MGFAGPLLTTRTSCLDPLPLWGQGRGMEVARVELASYEPNNQYLRVYLVFPKSQEHEALRHLLLFQRDYLFILATTAPSS